MATINDYYDTLGLAHISNDVTVFEQKFGKLKPTGKRWDGVNNWQRHFQAWIQLGVKDYYVSFNEPILTIYGNKATADIMGLEKVLRNGGDSAGGFSAVFNSELMGTKWILTKVDELPEAEINGVQ